MKKKVIVVAAHPDDEVLGCGATIAKYRSMNVPIRVIFMAEGVTSRFNDKELSMQHVVAATKLRNDNAFKALKILNIPKKEVYVNDRYCCRLDSVAQLELVKEIEFHIKEWCPTSVFTHAPYDINIDHRMTYESVLAASRPTNSCSVKSIYCFEVLSSTEWNPLNPFKANVFVDITDFINQKINALKAYGDEMRKAPHPRSEEVIRSLARFRGSQSGLNYAEAFSIVRSII